jgi:small subunit ribosomal protein S8
MVTDPIADMLTRLRNAGSAGLDSVQMPASKMKERLAVILKAEGYVTDYRVTQDDVTKPTLTITMKYGRDRRPAIAHVRRQSRPGRRVYVGHHDIPVVQNHLGVAILSTSHGVLTDRDARAKKVGGEVICEIW